MRVFISYSVDDQSLVRAIVEQLQPCADTVLWWDGSKELGEEAWPTIHSWIDQADVVLAILTGRTLARAMAVGNEIGYARAKGKFIIPLVAPEVGNEELGCLRGVTYERIRGENPGPAIEAVKARIATRQRQVADKALGFFLVVAGVIAVVWLLLKTRDREEDVGRDET